MSWNLKKAWCKSNRSIRISTIHGKAKHTEKSQTANQLRVDHNINLDPEKGDKSVYGIYLNTEVKNEYCSVRPMVEKSTSQLHGYNGGQGAQMMRGSEEKFADELSAKTGPKMEVTDDEKENRGSDQKSFSYIRSFRNRGRCHGTKHILKGRGNYDVEQRLNKKQSIDSKRIGFITRGHYHQYISGLGQQECNSHCVKQDAGKEMESVEHCNRVAEHGQSDVEEHKVLAQNGYNDGKNEGKTLHGEDDNGKVFERGRTAKHRSSIKRWGNSQNLSCDVRKKYRLRSSTRKDSTQTCDMNSIEERKHEHIFSKVADTGKEQCQNPENTYKVKRRVYSQNEAKILKDESSHVSIRKSYKVTKSCGNSQKLRRSSCHGNGQHIKTERATNKQGQNQTKRVEFQIPESESMKVNSEDAKDRGQKQGRKVRRSCEGHMKVMRNRPGSGRRISRDLLKGHQGRLRNPALDKLSCPHKFCRMLMLMRTSPMDDTLSEDELLFMTSSCDALPEEVDIDQLLSEGLELSPVRESPDGCSVSDDNQEELRGIDEAYVKFYQKHVESYSDSEASPELYSFEDFESEKEPCEPQLQIYDFLDNMTTNPRVNGKELFRSRTLPSIPIGKLNKSDLTLESNSDWWRANKRTTDVVHPNAKVTDDRPTTRWCSREDCQRARSENNDRRGKGRMLPRVPSHAATGGAPRSTAWTLGGADNTDSPAYATNSADSPKVSRPPQLYYTTPPKSQMASTANSDDKRLERRGSAKNSGLIKLARRLSHKDRRPDREERKVALRQRSVSLDCGEGRRSLLSPSSGECGENKASSIPPSPSMPSRLTSKGGNSGSTSPNIGRLSRRSSGGKRKSSGDLLEAGSMKTDRKKAERKNAYETQALFEAVENLEMDRVKVILQTNGIDVNSVNDEELTPLDIAVLFNHIPMARMLLAQGAKENPRFNTVESVEQRLLYLIDEVHRRINDLKMQQDLGAITPAAMTTNGTQNKEKENMLPHAEKRLKLLNRLKEGYDFARIPEAPTQVTLVIASSSSLLVSFAEPEQHNGGVVTRYKVEWSCYEDFSPLAGDAVVEDLRQLQYEIPDLVQGNMYYVRVSAWNIKGYGPHQVASPPYAIPSSWRELDNSKPRDSGKLKLLDDLFINIKNCRPPDAATIKDSHTPVGSPLHHRKSNMRKSIKNLFSSAPKFQKNLKRGVYLASLLYNEDRILVTNEENLPVIEVDESFSGANLHTDFHWMMKVASTWEDVKSLRQDMDKSSSSGAVLLRSKLLQAANQLQNSLGTQDLGQFFYRPIKDSQGSIVLTTINCVKDPKSVNTTALKWLPISKIQKRLSPAPDNPASSELLLSNISEMLHYHQTSKIPLEKGLYLGYLKLKSSVDLIRVLVPEKMPNVLPHVKIRNCPNVSREEWQWLQNLSVNDVKTPPTGSQLKFQNSLVSACKSLLQDLGISEDEAVSHRVYDMEVVELSHDVSFLLLLPPAEAVCSVPGHVEETSERSGHLTIPVQVFEMIHMYTYQYDFICRYSRLSSILEMDTHLAQQALREAFSSDEMTVAKERVEQLSVFQQTLDEAWRAMRWTMDIITYARDKNVKGGIPLGILYAPPSSPEASPNVERKDIDVTSTNSDMGYHSDRSSGDHSDGYLNNQHNRHLRFIGRHRRLSSDRASDGDSDSLLSVHSATCQPGILRVYAAYETGLAKGTSVKLHVTPRTTSREVINLVVQQLNKAVLTKGLNGPIYAEEQLDEFCLVAVIGARERVLRDDYQPLQLQNPWTKGRLYVRLRNNLLAALEQGHVTAV